NPGRFVNRPYIGAAIRIGSRCESAPCSASRRGDSRIALNDDHPERRSPRITGESHAQRNDSSRQGRPADAVRTQTRSRRQYFRHRIRDAGKMGRPDYRRRWFCVLHRTNPRTPITDHTARQTRRWRRLIMAAPLSEDIALRIGLAARLMPDVEPRVVLRALLDIMGEPITATKLSRLRAQRLRGAANGALADIDQDLLQQAVALLKGQGVERIEDPLPPIEIIDPAEMRKAVRVACASNTGERIDGHFGSCARFLIYCVAPERIALVEIREPA